MELRETHLRYLLTIYELGRNNQDVGTKTVADALHYAMASVTRMMAVLMDMKLLVRERYGKIYLTDTGFLLARELYLCMEILSEQFPAMGLELTGEEAWKLARTIAVNLPERCRKQLAGSGKKK